MAAYLMKKLKYKIVGIDKRDKKRKEMRRKPLPISLMNGGFTQ